MIKIEYSKDLGKAKIANISVGINGKKIVRLYEHNTNDNYKVNDTTEDEETLKIMQEDECLAELIFYHNASIESLIRVLEALKNKDFIKEEDNPEMYEKIQKALERWLKARLWKNNKRNNNKLRQDENSLKEENEAYEIALKLIKSKLKNEYIK